MNKILLMLSLSFWMSVAHANQLNPSIAVIGDSYTRATWADTKLNKLSLRPALDYLRLMLNPMNAAKVTPTDSDEQSDLMTYEDFVRREFMARDAYSFILSKEQPWSLRSRMLDLGAENRFHNFAQLGGTYFNATEQLKELKAFYADPNNHTPAPELLFVNLNGLDFIAQRGSADLVFDIKNFLSHLLAKQAWDVYITLPVNSAPLFQKGDRLALSPILNPKWSRLVGNLLEKGFGGGETIHFINKVLAEGMTCNEAYNILEISLHQNSLDAHNHRIESFRSLILEELDSYQNGYQDYRGKIGFGTVELPENAEDLLAIDCMHMNIEGQKYIADTLWPQFKEFLESRMN